jgi:hypothetical protein
MRIKGKSPAAFTFVRTSFVLERHFFHFLTRAFHSLVAMAPYACGIAAPPRSGVSKPSDSGRRFLANADLSETKVGFLAKRSSRGQWQRRYFTLYNGNQLVYRNAKGNTEIKAVIDLTQARSCCQAPDMRTIELALDDEQYGLRADSVRAGTSWFKVLSEACGTAGQATACQATAVPNASPTATRSERPKTVARSAAEPPLSQDQPPAPAVHTAAATRQPVWWVGVLACALLAIAAVAVSSGASDAGAAGKLLVPIAAVAGFFALSRSSGPRPDQCSDASGGQEASAAPRSTAGGGAERRSAEEREEEVSVVIPAGTGNLGMRLELHHDAIMVTVASLTRTADTGRAQRAELAGVLVGDRVQAVDGRRVRSAAEAAAALQRGAGSAVSLQLVRPAAGAPSAAAPDAAVPRPKLYARPRVAALLEEHAAALAELKRMLGSDFPPPPSDQATDTDVDPFLYDDLFLLRYILSHKDKGKLPKAAHAVRETLAYRRANGAVLAQVRRTDVGGNAYPKPEVDAAYKRLLLQGVVQNRRESLAGDHVLIVRDGLADKSGFMDAVGQLAAEEYLLLKRERLYADIDRRTRSTGLLIKVVIVVDAAGGSLGKLRDRRYMKADGKCSKLAELYYPQLMGTIVLVNPPALLHLIMKVARVFISGNTLDKITLVQPGRAQDLFLQSLYPAEEIPKFLGGGAPDEMDEY